LKFVLSRFFSGGSTASFSSSGFSSVFSSSPSVGFSSVPRSNSAGSSLPVVPNSAGCSPPAPGSPSSGFSNSASASTLSA
jgi:hypothetical protein